MSLKLLQQLKHSYLVYGYIGPRSFFKWSNSKADNCLKQATAALGISTIVLGVENADLKSQIEEKTTTPLVTKATATTSSSVVTSTTTTTPSTSTITTQLPPDMSKHRLPTTVSPTTYDLYLYPDLATGLFKGKVSADAKILETTNDIVMHSNKLNVSKVLIGDEPGTFELDPLYELLTVRKLDGTSFLKGSVVNVTVDFGGDMKNRIVGLYTSSYTNPAGVQRYMATSKFEPTYARQAFPCFDEPNLKATYKVHILKPDDPEYIALSNNPQESEEKVPEGVMVHFEETVPMSTYLSCFIVSDFKYTNTTFDNNDGKEIPFRVYASPHQLEKTTYAGEVGKKVIEYYVKYFDIPYPLPKLDMVAIPDFVSGAMEHWGLVTYRETAHTFCEQ